MPQFRAAAIEWAAGDAAAATTARAVACELSLRLLVLVEGVSDQVAVETLAARRGIDLDAQGACIIPLGGATNIRRFVGIVGPDGLDVELAGLYDAAEERYFRRALEGVGLGTELTAAGMEQLGFFACRADLEQELIRALGENEVERVIEEQGDLRSFRALQRQPAQRSWTVERQLRRFMGSIGGRKARYARALVMELSDAQTPRPLELLVAYVGRRPTS
jgi:hypothetical protein